MIEKHTPLDQPSQINLVYVRIETLEKLEYIGFLHRQLSRVVQYKCK